MSLRNLGNLNIKDLSLLILGTCLLGAALYIHARSQKPEIVISKQQSAVNVNTLFLQLASLGNTRLVADILWIQTLIESDLEKFQGDSKNNWMFLRFNSISILDPKFYENYLYGGQYLSIIKDDPQSAEKIFAKGLQFYANDYMLNFNQGFNYYFELNDIEKGLVHLERIKDHPDAPGYLTSLLIKLKHQINQNPKDTILLLKEAYDKTQDQALRNKLAHDIYSIKATIDLACLNNRQENCETFDTEGKPYIFDGKTYKAQKEFQPYKIFRRSQD